MKIIEQNLFRKWIIKTSVLIMFLPGMAYSSQKNGQQELTIQLQEVNLDQALKQIRQISGYYILYNLEDVKGIKDINVNMKNASLEQILDHCLKETTLTYKINENTILITHKDSNSQNKNEVIRIKGKVMDTSKLPLPGVTVMIKGTSLGTVTNTKGIFDFTLPKMELPVNLRFSFIGMDSQDVKYTGQDSLFVTMIESTETLGEVVVTGFGTMDKRLNTSAITSINMEDIFVPGVTSLDQMLEGRVPGMVFMQNSGQVGATPKLRVRGTTTVLGNQEPLWVVDDIIVDDPVEIDINRINDLDFTNLLGNAISGLNPGDIERLDILKDASATALYGARAGNGVIVITTKKGQAGPPRFSYSFSSSITRRPYYSDRAIYMMNSQDRVELSRELIENGVKYSDDVLNGLFGYEEAYVNCFKNGTIDIEEFNRLSSFYQTVNTDWFKLLMRNSFSHNHNIGVSGGSSSSSYRISIGYTDEQGAIKKEFGKRYTALINLTSQFKGTTINFKADGSKYDRQYTPTDVGVNTYAYSTSRAIPQYTIDGERWSYYKNTKPYDIFTEIENSQYKIDQKRVGFNLNLKQKLFDFLTLNLTGSYNYSFSLEETWYGELSHYITSMNTGNKVNHMCPFGGELKTSTSRNENYTLRGQFDFNKFLDESNHHFIFASFGGEMRSSKYKKSDITERGYMRNRGGMFPDFGENYSEILEYRDFVTWILGKSFTNYNYSLSNTVSSYFSASYSYKNKYVFNVNGRVDFSNAFGDRSREKLNPIWSVSGRWDMKKDLFEFIRQINQLDFRFSYGLQGNMKNDQPSRLILTRGRYDVDYGKFTSTVKYFPNPDLKWEKTHSVNAQLDFSFFNRSITGTVSYFYKKTIDAFYTKNVSDINGVTTYIINKGNIENKGFEFNFNVNPVKMKYDESGRRGFYWRFDPQISQTLNRFLDKSIKKEQKFVKDEYELNDYLQGNAVVEGVPLNTMFSFKFKSLDSSGKPVFYDLEKDNEQDLLVKYEEMLKEVVYRCFLTKSGRRVPILQGGFNNVFGYRNFQLSLNFSYSLGNKVRLLKLVSGEYSGISPQPTQNVRREFKDRWRVPGDELFKIIPGVTKNQKYVGEGNFWFQSGTRKWTDEINMYAAYDFSDIRVVSGNYLRLQSFNLAYQFGNKFLNKLKLSNGYVSFSGSNVFTWAHKNLRGQDPSQSGTSSLINLSVRPMYSLSFNVGF